MVRKEAILFGIGAWVILTYLFSKNDAAADGVTAYGFPFYFYTKAGGKMILGSGEQMGFDFIHLIWDLCCLAGLVYIVNRLLTRSLKKIKPDKPTYL
ncbi:hypothetical protein [Mucilaginibacter sp.]|uniref:hypothetical protein n=1 Tax=Mucilaginibacter sp. TaxID=1882438 RepID=UPI003262E712